MMQLCRDYDLRFLVVADRYNYHDKDGVKVERSLEDVKERYYTVTRKMLLARNPMADPAKKAEIAQLQYDKGLFFGSDSCIDDQHVAKDLERKQYIQRLFERSYEEIQEEERLLVEARRIEAHRKRLEKDRENLVRLLNADLFSYPTLAHLLTADAGAERPSGAFESSKKKSKKRSMDDLPMKFAESRFPLQQF